MPRPPPPTPPLRQLTTTLPPPPTDDTTTRRMPPASTPRFPVYGCIFCDRYYTQRAYLNRHLDHYLLEYCEAYGRETVETYCIENHPLEVMRTIRSCGERHPGCDRDDREDRTITWHALKFKANDPKLDLAKKLVRCSSTPVLRKQLTDGTSSIIVYCSRSG